MRGLGPLKLPAIGAVVAVAAVMTARCGGDDGTCDDASCDVSIQPLAARAATATSR
jgi:hypothetical protein